MSAKVSRASIIGSIVAKDLKTFTRDKMWMIMTPFFLILIIVMFWVVPDAVDETITVGVYPSEMAESLRALAAGEDAGEASGLDVVSFDSDTDMAAVVAGEIDEDAESWDESWDGVSIALAFPEDFVERTIEGEKSTVTVYVDSAIPEEITGAMSSAVREIAYGLQAAALGQDADEAMPIVFPEEEQIILGEDRAGEQVPLREKFRPMMAFMILMIESMALSGLVAVEIRDRTVTAILVTPAKTGDIIAAKWITGGILAASQALVFLVATRSLGEGWPIVVTFVALGALMMSAIAMISGAMGKDFMGTLFFSMIFLIPLMIPTFGVLFPGTAATWVKVLPSYGLVQGMLEVMGYGGSWSDVTGDLGLVAIWDIVLVIAALIVLKRKVESV